MNGDQSFHEDGDPGTRFCLRCQELLPPAGDPGRCRRCGLPFDPSNPATYRTRALFLRWKFWLPGFCIAVASGVLGYICIALGGNMGVTLFFVVPLAFGAIVGYATNVRAAAAIALGVMAAFEVVFTLVCIGESGIFCGFTGLFLLFLPLSLLGVGLGIILQIQLKLSRWSQRFFLPVLPLIALPFLSDLVERQFPRPVELQTVATSAVIDAPPETAWRSVVFYEEVRHPPPALLRLTLPRPVRAVGKKDRVGNVVRCVYENGHLVKQVTHVEEGRALGFRVLEQKLHFERDVTLLDGEFRLAPQPDGKTTVTLVTRYQRHLYPAWLWEPVERRVVRTLHAHVLEGMRRQALEDVDPRSSGH